MAEPFLGELRLMPYHFAPKGWAFCEGQLLSIAQNTALFSLLGTYYGGNGTTNFALPDLRDRSVVGVGSAPGLTPYDIGETMGTPAVTLLQTNTPAHIHPLGVSHSAGTQASPVGAYPAVAPTGVGYLDGNNNNQSNPNAVNPAGGSQPHENRQPYLTLAYAIALVGIFPSRN